MAQLAIILLLVAITARTNCASGSIRREQKRQEAE
jgi:hypothetical protein